MGEKCILAVAQIALLYEHSDGVFWPRVSLVIYLGLSFTGVWTKYKRNRTFPEEIIIKFFTEAGSFPHLSQVTWEISFRNRKSSMVAYEPSDNGFTCDRFKPHLAFCPCRKILLFNTAVPVLDLLLCTAIKVLEWDAAQDTFSCFLGNTERVLGSLCVGKIITWRCASA